MEFCIRRDPTMKKCIACDLGYTQKIANVCSRYMITLAVAKRCTPNEIPAHEKCIPKTPGCVAYD